MHFVSATLSPVWKLFVSKVIPEDAPASISSVPDTYTLPSGEVLKPVDVVFEEERANLNKILGRLAPVGTCGLLVGVLEAEDDGVVIYGAGADWWWTCFVNGEEVFDRSRSKCANGNSRGTFLKTDWIFPIRVRKGANIIAFHIVSGSFWSIGTGVLPYRDDTDISVCRGGLETPRQTPCPTMLARRWSSFSPLRTRAPRRMAVRCSSFGTDAAMMAS